MANRERNQEDSIQEIPTKDLCSAVIAVHEEFQSAINPLLAELERRADQEDSDL